MDLAFIIYLLNAEVHSLMVGSSTQANALNFLKNVHYAYFFYVSID